MSKKAFYNQLLLEEKELEKALISVRNLKEYYKDDALSKVDTQAKLNLEEQLLPKVVISDEFNKEYSKHFSHKEKVEFVMKRINTGFVVDVAQYLVNIDDSLSFERAKKIATVQCSRLYNDGELDIEKFGRKYKYSIKGYGK